jgi:drug/metabolite transporter (DMT)-like permease
MALGSISYVLAVSKLPVGTAAAISTSYVILVVLLSWIFLHESLSWMKVTGIVLTIVGVALLSWEQPSGSQ